MALRFAANLSMMFNEVPFIERFGAAHRAGFTAVEFSFAYDHPAEALAEQLEAHSLTVALFNMPPGAEPGDRGLAAVAGREAEFRGCVETALGYAELLKPRNVHVMSGNASTEDSSALATYVANLRYAAECFVENSAGLVIEPINSRDIPGYFMNDFDLAEKIIADIDKPNLGLQFDIYHRQVMRGDVCRGLESMLKIIRHVQIAAAPLRHEPGTGELNDVDVLSHLNAIGYDGFVGCEYRPVGRTEAGLGWMKNVPHSSF